jgi:hypothetical protein
MNLALDDTNAFFSALVLIKSQIFLSIIHFLEVGKNKLELQFNDQRVWAYNFI